MRWLFLVVLLTMSTGCSGLLPALQAAGQGAQWLGGLLTDAADAERAYRNRHPSMEAEQEAAAALRTVRAALTAYNAVLAAGEDVAAGDVESARAELLRAYAAFRALYDATQILSGAPPAGGPEGMGPVPEPFGLPTEAEVAVVLKTL